MQAALIQYKAQLTERYEQQLKLREEEQLRAQQKGVSTPAAAEQPAPPAMTSTEAGASNVRLESSAETPARHRKRDVIKGFIKRSVAGGPTATPVADPVDLESRPVEEGNWELVDKSPARSKACSPVEKEASPLASPHEEDPTNVG